MGRVLKNTCEVCHRPRRAANIGTIFNASNTRQVTYCADNTGCAQVARARVEGRATMRTKGKEEDADDF